MLNPSVSVPCLLQIIVQYAAFSGYKVNFPKSVAMPLGNLKHPPDHLNPFPFKLSSTCFIYLGIYITPKLNQLFQANPNPLFDKNKTRFEEMERSSRIMVGPNLPSENKCPSTPALSNANDSHLIQS